MLCAQIKGDNVVFDNAKILILKLITTGNSQNNAYYGCI